MRTRTERNPWNHRVAAVAAVALLVLALAAPVTAGASEAPLSGSASPAITGLDRLWSSVVEAWTDLGRLFAPNETGNGERRTQTANQPDDPVCRPDCEIGVDIDPDG